MSDPFRRLLGAVVGGGIGYGAFLALQARDIRALGVVGVCLALGAGYAAPRRRLVWGLVVAVLALAATILVAWRHDPFRGDETLGEYVRDVADASWNTKLNYAATVLAGLWFGTGRNRRAEKA